MKKSLEKSINELLLTVVDYELNRNNLNEKMLKKIISEKIRTFLSSLKSNKFEFDITPTHLKKVEVVLESELNTTEKEVGDKIQELLTQSTLNTF